MINFPENIVELMTEKSKEYINEIVASFKSQKINEPDTIVTNITALLAKDFGFSIPTHTSYPLFDEENPNKKIQVKRTIRAYSNLEHKQFISAPTQSLLNSWLRTTFGLHVNITSYTPHTHWIISVTNLYTNELMLFMDDDNILTEHSYEMSMELGLIIAMEIIKFHKDNLVCK